jgi:outer membrane protein OmpA-like peptidoglycan-associated protein
LIVRELVPFPDPISLEPAVPYFKYAPSERPLIAFPDDVLFAFDSATIKPSAVPLPERAIAVISSRDRGRVVIEGHTDSVGGDQ